MKKNGSGRTVSYNRYFYIFLIPFVLIFVLFNLYPLLYTFALSVSDMGGFKQTYNYVGFRNYSQLLHDAYFVRCLWNVLRIWVCNFVPQLILALILAAWLTDSQIRMRGARVYKFLLFLPYLLTATSVALLFRYVFDYPSGMINQLLVRLGIRSDSFEFFRNKTASSLIVSFIQTWMFTGYTMVMFMSGITGISETLYEAAYIDGATIRKTFFHITIPLLKPIILFLLIQTIVGGLQIFDIPFIIGGTAGSPDGSLKTAVMYIYSTVFTGNSNYAYGSTLTVGLFAITVLFSLIAFRTMRVDKD